MEKKVLTIDDSQTIRTIISKHLAQFPVRVFEAENGEEGVDCARENNPDLILLDYNMPIMDGYHTLVELRSDPGLKSIPVVMVTTETSKETVVKLLKLGLNDYIAKPFTREVLLKKINPLLGLYNGEEIPSGLSPGVSPEKPFSREISEDQTAGMVEGSSPAVLVVDDKSGVREMLKEYLSERFDIVMADGGRAALAAMAQRSFDHIFLDLNMPDMSGFEVLELFQKKTGSRGSERKVVAMTLRSAVQDIHQASEAGIPVILYKPFTRADVASAIDQSVDSRTAVLTKRFHYVRVNGNIMTLECPGKKSSKYRLFAAALEHDIFLEIETSMEEGSDRLIVKIGDGFLENRLVSRAFFDLLQRLRRYSILVRLVADTPQSRDILKKNAESAEIPMDVSLECALKALAG
jgi:two-component system, cell cycle response regulator